MLGRYDETLLHQAAVTFDQTPISDHRFFDRVWFGGFGTDDVRFMCGLAAYKNTNTVDGYFVISRANKQHNLRLSRPMLPDAAHMAVGPLKIEVVEPLNRLRILLTPGAKYRFSAELEFVATSVAHQETPHIRRADGRLVQDYSRFDQVGRFHGWIDSAEERVAVQDWFGARDHSWGVRPGVGGYEPITSLSNTIGNPDDVGPASEGFLLISLMFDSAPYNGFFQLQEDGSGRVLYMDGVCFRDENGSSRPLIVERIEHDLQFIEGTRTCSSGNLRITLSDGALVSMSVRALLPSWCFKGTGYDFGYEDERGLGVFRGDLLESDVYDLSHAEDVLLPNGRKIRPWHRESDAVLRVDDQPGFAHFAVISSGRIPRYHLETPTTNKAI